MFARLPKDNTIVEVTLVRVSMQEVGLAARFLLIPFIPRLFPFEYLSKFLKRDNAEMCLKCSLEGALNLRRMAGCSFPRAPTKKFFISP